MSHRCNIVSSISRMPIWQRFQLDSPRALFSLCSLCGFVFFVSSVGMMRSVSVAGLEISWRKRNSRNILTVASCRWYAPPGRSSRHRLQITNFICVPNTTVQDFIITQIGNDRILQQRCCFRVTLVVCIRRVKPVVSSEFDLFLAGRKGCVSWWNLLLWMVSVF